MTHTFETLSGLKYAAVQPGTHIELEYHSQRGTQCPTTTTLEGEVTEVNSHRLETMIHVEPYDNSLNTRYVALFDDTSNIHSHHSSNGMMTLNEIDTTVTCTVETDE